MACPLVSAPVRVILPAGYSSADKEVRGLPLDIVLRQRLWLCYHQERMDVAIGEDLLKLASSMSAKRAAALATVACYSRNGVHVGHCCPCNIFIVITCICAYSCT